MIDISELVVYPSLMKACYDLTERALARLDVAAGEPGYAAKWKTYNRTAARWNRYYGDHCGFVDRFRSSEMFFNRLPAMIQHPLPVKQPTVWVEELRPLEWPGVPVCSARVDHFVYKGNLVPGAIAICPHRTTRVIVRDKRPSLEHPFPPRDQCFPEGVAWFLHRAYHRELRRRGEA